MQSLGSLPRAEQNKFQTSTDMGHCAIWRRLADVQFQAAEILTLSISDFCREQSGRYLRHSFAPLGQSEIALTMNAYSHVVPELQRDAAKRIQAILER
jgi:hypothetical protein